MINFIKIKEALKYIDAHLDEPISFEFLADKFHFSPYYFHRMFSVIVGKSIAAYIRDRRMERACTHLSETDKPVIEIGMDCGYGSAQAFSRAFKDIYGLPPSEYRRQGYTPSVVTVDEMIIKFTNRLRGGIFLNPKIIKRNKLIIAGVSGDGSRTGEVWQAFEKLNNDIGLPQKLSDNGYEIRIHGEGGGIVHVGFAVSNEDVNPEFTIMTLPASQYASFDVYVAKGYESENNAMNEWLETNEAGWRQRFLDGKSYVAEYYDERFNGNETDSIVEIWVPIEKICNA